MPVTLERCLRKVPLRTGLDRWTLHRPTATTQLAGRARANELASPHGNMLAHNFLHEHVKCGHVS
jgi:hypothetical protein